MVQVACPKKGQGITWFTLHQEERIQGRVPQGSESHAYNRQIRGSLEDLGGEIQSKDSLIHDATA